MFKVLRKIGKRKGPALSRAMLKRLGVTGRVKVRLQGNARPPAAQAFAQALEATFGQYSETMKWLAK